MLLDQYNLLSKIEPQKGPTSDDLFSAIDHLVKAARIIEECRVTMEEGLFDESLIQKLEESWNEVNPCRVHTENILFIEELLSSAPPCMVAESGKAAGEGPQGLHGGHGACLSFARHR